MKRLLLCTALFAACAPAPANDPAPQTSRTPLLRVGDRWTMRDLQIRFAGVEADSRCRPRVQCIREGEARVLLEVATGGAAPQRLGLLTSPPDSARRRYGDYLIVVDSLTPRPEATGEAYRVRLRVSAGE